jgi:membrane protein YqaA with SNARE-associated domain
VLDYLLMVFLAFLGILCPIFNTEVSLLAMSHKVDNQALLCAAAAFGSTGGFVVFYFVGAGSRNISRKWKERVDAIDLGKFHKSSLLVMAMSSLASIPPCTPLSIAAGTLRYSLTRFVPVFLVFRMIKYSIIALFYQQLHDLLLRGVAALEGVWEPVLRFLEHLFSGP